MRVGVAFIIGQLGLGGAEQQLYYLLSGLDRSRFHPIVISLGPTPDEYWEKPIRNLGVRLWHVGRSLGRPGRIIQITRLLRSEMVHIVHSWDLHTNPYSALAGRLAGIPLRLGSMRFNYEVILGEKLVRWIGYLGLDVMVVNSTKAENQLKDFRLTKATVRLLPNGVHIPQIASKVNRLRLKVDLGFSDNDLLIGSIGRLDQNKNHAMLLRAFASLSSQWPTLRLIIIGEGPLKLQLSAMANEMGIASKVSLPGAIALAARYLPAMEVCCLTSHTEGMPNLIMEAAAAGLPVISTGCGDSADLIEDGVSGYLVSPDDHVSMAAYLNVLLANPEHCVRMGRAGRETMHRKFSVDSMIMQMMQIYEDALVVKALA